ncbi:MAG: restriction endonuclease subunit S [Gemmatimonadetes bacterium]|nr:restriction endonuclease subunit S [Gemmatimonadota bacterium]
MALGELGHWSGGGTPSKANVALWQGGNIPWVSPKDMKVDIIRDSEDHITEVALEASPASLLSRGAILVVTRSGILQHTLPVAVTEVRVAVNQDLKALSPHQGLHSGFIARALKSLEDDMLLRCTKDGTTVHSIDTRKLLAYQIPIAPSPEQGRVVEAIQSYLSRLDEAVALLERVRRNLKRYRAAVLKAAVEGRLVPTEAALARAEGRDYEPADVLLKHILAERRRRWEQAELERLKAAGKPPENDRWTARYPEPVAADVTDLPSLPEGWCWASWSQIGFSQNGRAFPSAEYQAHGVRLLRPGNLHASGQVQWTEANTRRLPASWAEAYSRWLVGPHELVMNLTAQSLKDEFLGRVCMTGPTERCLLNQRIARLSPVLVNPKYLLWVFKSRHFRGFVESLNTGSLIQHMFTSQLSRCPVPLPPLAEQLRIAAAAEEHLAIAESVERAITSSMNRCSRLRPATLRWAFEGKLVDQDPTDEPASVLLERIRRETAATGAPSGQKQEGQRRRRGKMRGGESRRLEGRTS